MLSRAVEQNQGEFTLVDTAQNILSNAWQLWTVIEDGRPVAATVTELVAYPAKNVCRVILLGGKNFDEWKHLIATIEDFALVNGCTALEAIVRPGMAKRASSVGFESRYTVIRKDLRGKLQ